MASSSHTWVRSLLSIVPSQPKTAGAWTRGPSDMLLHQLWWHHRTTETRAWLSLLVVHEAHRGRPSYLIMYIVLNTSVCCDNINHFYSNINRRAVNDLMLEHMALASGRKRITERKRFVIFKVQLKPTKDRLEVFNRLQCQLKNPHSITACSYPTTKWCRISWTIWAIEAMFMYPGYVFQCSCLR